MDFFLLSRTPLFQGLIPADIPAALERLDAQEKHYARGETILTAGAPIQRMALVLSGGVTIEKDDFWGNRSILSYVGPGQIFAETYACLPNEPLMINAVAAEDTDLLLLSAQSLLRGGGAEQELLLRNLLAISLQKNLQLSRRSFHTAPKSIRGRLLSYLSDQAALQGSPGFSIPFDRQQLADYLGVDRSALSGELGKLRREGLLSVRKNQFQLHTDILDA